MAEWAATLDSYLTVGGDDAKKCAIFAALCNKADCALYAASPAAGDAGWGALYKEDHSQELEQADGSKVATNINEASTLKFAVENELGGENPTQGIWMGGNQYKITKRDTEFEVGEAKTKCIHIVAPLKGSKKQGIQVVVTENTCIIASWDEDQGIAAGALTAGIESFTAWAITDGGL